jgi:hypothetical protein
MKWHLNMKSGNAKTGPIPVTTSSRKTCPPSCPFLKNGCYADNAPLAWFWDKVTAGTQGLAWEAFLRAVRMVPKDQIARFNQAGDLPGRGEHIDKDKMLSLVHATAGSKWFTYTHKHTTACDRKLIKYANTNGFTVNLSANSLAHADTLAKTGAGPVVVILPSDATENTTTEEGRRVVVCPATQRDGVTCMTCGLCARADRTIIVGFPAHGSRMKKVEEVCV